MELPRMYVMLQKIALQPEADVHLVTSLLTKTILVVKNDATRNWPFSQHLPLKSHHYALLASTADAALRLVKQIKPDLFILDYYLLDMDGLELYRQLHETKGLEDIPAIIVGADLLQDVAWKVDTHHLVILSKSFSIDELLRIMTRVELSASK